MLHCLNEMNFPMLSVAHDIIRRNNCDDTGDQTLQLKKWGKHSSTKTRTLRCSSSWCCQLKTSAAPQFTPLSVTQRIQQHLSFSCLLTSALN